MNLKSISSMKYTNFKWILTIVFIVSITLVSGQNKNILKYRSTNNDYENATDILKTNYEISYHTFDFNKKTITMKSKLNTGQWKTFVFKWTKITEPYNNGYIEFTIVNDKGVYQIWRSALNNIGYEFYNGTKLVYYDLELIN